MFKLSLCETISILIAFVWNQTDAKYRATKGNSIQIGNVYHNLDNVTFEQLHLEIKEETRLAKNVYFVTKKS